MINNDLPVIFTNLLVAASSCNDGSMKFGTGDTSSIVQNRRQFLDEVGVSLEQTVLVRMNYERDTFTTYRVATKKDGGEGMATPEARVADGLLTTEAGVALFLPLADCIGLVLHDPMRQVLMVSHMGRHNIEQNGATKSVEYMKRHHCRPEDIEAWMTPSVGQDSYPLHAFDERSLSDVTRQQLIAAGILDENIEISPIDTAKSEDYFSHSEYLKGNRQTDGRFAVVAMMHEQGEPASL